MNKSRTKSASSTATRSHRSAATPNGSSRGASSTRKVSSGSQDQGINVSSRGSTSSRGYDHQIEINDQEGITTDRRGGNSNMDRSENRDYSDSNNQSAQYGQGREGSRNSQSDHDQDREMNDQQGPGRGHDRNQGSFTEYSARGDQGFERDLEDEESKESVGFDDRSQHFDENSEFDSNSNNEEQEWQSRQGRGHQKSQQGRGSQLSHGGRQSRSQSSRSNSR